MIYSAGCEYAIRALTRLAKQTPAGGFCLLRQIVDQDRLPEHFVGKLLQTLVRAEILVSAKGRNGGFALRVPASEITLRQIADAIDGDDQDINRCVLGFEECDEHQHCPHHECWNPIRKQIDELLNRTTLTDLVESMGKKQKRRR